MTKIIDSVGTLQLIDTGRRCSTRDVRILRVQCTAGCTDDNLLHDAILAPYWNTMKMLNGYHQGCDPKSIWRTDPVAAKLQQSTAKSLIGAPPDACIACDQIDCTGADDKCKEVSYA